MCWPVPKGMLSVELPEGFKLTEDAAFVYLYYYDCDREDKEPTLVATFSSTDVDPERIKSEAEDYLRSLK